MMAAKHGTEPIETKSVDVITSSGFKATPTLQKLLTGCKLVVYTKPPRHRAAQGQARVIKMATSISLKELGVFRKLVQKADLETLLSR
jgi:hypothetical protein